ncbi:unnamed protein product [Closterium sp. Naga37s-1]|nr:unnamed protein product [Closterium sp. Naga37s-1]
MRVVFSSPLPLRQGLGFMASRTQQLRGMLGRTRRACAATKSRDSLLSATWQLTVASDALASSRAHGVAAPGAVGNAAAAGGAAGGASCGAASGAAAAAAFLQPLEAIAVHLQLQASAPAGLRSLGSLEGTPQPSLLPHALLPSPAHALLCKPWGAQPRQPLNGLPWMQQVVGGGRTSHSHSAAAFHSCAQPQQLSAALLLRLPRGMQPLVLRPVEAATGIQQQHRWYASSTQGSSNKDGSGSGRREVVRQEEEDVFSSITDKIPERPVSAAEGASYSIVILAALAVAAGAAYFVVKELLLEPKEYKVFNKALQRVQNDPQVISRLGSPITGYGQESRNRAARQRISHRVWTDEEGVERIQVMGPSIASPITLPVPSIAQSACNAPRPPGAGHSDALSPLHPASLGPAASQSESMDVRGTHASADVDNESNDRWQQWQEDRQRETSSALEPTPKRLRGSYRCRRCGQPKKGHVCPLTSPSPAPPYARRPCQSNPHHANHSHPPNPSSSVGGDPSCGGACGNTRDCGFDSPSGITRADMRKPASCSMGNMQPLRLPDASTGPADSANAYTADGGRSSACHGGTIAHISLTAPALTASCRSLPSRSGLSDSNFSFPAAHTHVHGNAHGAITSRMAPHCASPHSLPPLSHSSLRPGPPGASGPAAAGSVRPAVQRSPQDMCMLNILAKLPPRDLLSASSCCRRWRRLAAEIWGNVEAAALSLDATPSLATDALVYVPFMLRRCPRLVHLSLQAARCVDDRLLHHIAAEQPNLESLVIRTAPNVACHVTDNGMAALLHGCASLRAVDMDGCIALPSLTVTSQSLTALTLSACARLSRLSLACPAMQRLSLSLLPAPAPPSPAPPARTCSQTHAHASAQMSGDPAHAEAVIGHVASLAAPLERLHIASPYTTDSMVAALVRAHGSSLCALSITHSLSLTDGTPTRPSPPTTALAHHLSSPFFPPSTLMFRLPFASLHSHPFPLMRPLHTPRAPVRPSPVPPHARASEGVADICRACPHLQHLDLSASPNLSDAALHAISASLSHSLTHLLLAACPGITPRGVQALVQRLPNLELLDVGRSLLPRAPSPSPTLASAASTTSAMGAAGGGVDGWRGNGGGQWGDVGGDYQGEMGMGMDGGMGGVGGEGSNGYMGGGDGGGMGASSATGTTRGVAAGGEGRRLELRSNSLRKLSLWGCSLLQTLVLDCPQLEHLNVNLCTALHPSAYGCRLNCPSLRFILAVGCPVSPHTLLRTACLADQSPCMGDGMGDGMGGSMGDGMGDGMVDGIGDGIGDGMGVGMGNGMGDGMGNGMGDGMGDGYGDDMGDGMGNGMGVPPNTCLGDDMGVGMGDGMGNGMGDSMDPSQSGYVGDGMGNGMDPSLGSYVGDGMMHAQPSAWQPPSHTQTGNGMVNDMGNGMGTGMVFGGTAGPPAPAAAAASTHLPVDPSLPPPPSPPAPAAPTTATISNTSMGTAPITNPPPVLPSSNLPLLPLLIPRPSSPQAPSPLGLPPTDSPQQPFKERVSPEKWHGVPHSPSPPLPSRTA